MWSHFSGLGPVLGTGHSGIDQRDPCSRAAGKQRQRTTREHNKECDRCALLEMCARRHFGFFRPANSPTVPRRMDSRTLMLLPDLWKSILEGLLCPVLSVLLSIILAVPNLPLVPSGVGVGGCLPFYITCLISSRLNILNFTLALFTRNGQLNPPRSLSTLKFLQFWLPVLMTDSREVSSWYWKVFIHQ